MASRRPARIALSTPVAFVLSLVLATPATGTSWDAPIALSSSGFPGIGGLVTLDTSTAAAVYLDGGNVYVRRSTNAGASWGDPILLSSEGDYPAIAGSGANVDAVWNDSETGVVHYARSTDGGASFGASSAISPAGSPAWDPSVARGQNGLVAVVWEDSATQAVTVRVSKDGGASFGSAEILANSGAGLGTAVAIASPIIYVAHSRDSQVLQVKRSVDSGASWSVPVQLTAMGTLDPGLASGGSLSITAAGGEAYVAYTVASTGGNLYSVRYRRTTDQGAAWSGEQELSPAEWASSQPNIALQGGIVRAVFERCTPEAGFCDFNHAIYYRESSNGINWTAAERVSPANAVEAYHPSVGFAGESVLVLYTGWKTDDQTVYVRRGTPQSLPPTDTESPPGLPMSGQTGSWLLAVVVALVSAAFGVLAFRRFPARA